MPRLTIDGRQIDVSEGTTVIQAAERLGIFIPRYCYHPGLSIAGNCRICLVEVAQTPKLQIACNLTATDGMVVHTQNEKARDGRRAVLEFLLANHPLDCPVCDQSGECDLQNFYMNFGLYDPRFKEHKVKKRKAEKIGPHVMLDQERCILCSRCVRFTDEISKTGELGIFNRGDKAELNVCPGEVLDNPYSTNVVDICPVGALTEVDFRFKARVWYLSSAPSVCNGCSQGCNIDIHYLLDRPHLNDGARIVRLKPRPNPEVNEWWMCDEGRYGFGWVDRNRLKEVRGPSGETAWERALDEIAEALTGSQSEQADSGTNGGQIGVIASSQLTNEELFLIREIFSAFPNARLTAAVPQRSGYQDDFLIKADKNPNSMGARLAELTGPEAFTAEQLVEEGAAGNLDLLWVFGHDLVEMFGEEKIRRLSRQVGLFVFSGTNENSTTELADWVLPTAAYMEKDGTFVNCHGRVQRIGRAFPPLGNSREDWKVLLQLAGKLGRPLDWKDPQQTFEALATAPQTRRSTDPQTDQPSPFQGLTYEIIGRHGADLNHGGEEIP